MNDKPKELRVDDSKYIREDLIEQQNIESTKLVEALIGKYVIVRSRNEGVNAGYLVAADETGCALREARRLWYHKPKKESWYEGVAESGLHEDSKISCKCSGMKIIIEGYSVVQCSPEAEKSIREKKSHEG